MTMREIGLRIRGHRMDLVSNAAWLRQAKISQARVLSQVASGKGRASVMGS